MKGLNDFPFLRIVSVHQNSGVLRSFMPFERMVCILKILEPTRCIGCAQLKPWLRHFHVPARPRTVPM